MAKTRKMAKTKKIAKIINVMQIYKAEGLSKVTIDAYYEKILRLIQVFYPAKKYDIYHYISCLDAGRMLKKYDKIDKTLKGMYPLNTGDEETTRKNTENIKTYYSAIRTLIRDNKLDKWIGETLQKKYSDRLQELIAETQEARKDLPPREIQVNHPKLDWDLILERRDEFFSDKEKTVDRLKVFLPVGFYTYMNPRRLEYRLIKVYRKQPRHVEGLNYILLKKDKIEMVLDEFKTRKVLPTWKADLPEALAIVVREFVEKEHIIEGGNLFQNTKGNMYSQPTFSVHVQKCFSKVIGYTVGVDELRTYRLNNMADNFREYSAKDRQELAESMGDKSIETNQSYIRRRHVSELKEAGGDEEQENPAVDADEPAQEPQVEQDNSNDDTVTRQDTPDSGYDYEEIGKNLVTLLKSLKMLS